MIDLGTLFVTQHLNELIHLCQVDQATVRKAIVRDTLQ